ncbi:glycerol-3-phosphate 1-O-acyltransferase PlsY [Megasphaera vaginalis (ex Srinivasan et al. 2021)]|uniref:Glycerol-3-phosphate acyltransferase n=1 Tax=Megasphaera vaginalis (ex Srinivasan et al. 2021) TaxID=1111454 RepID=U7UFP7_9FIRM|nr:glycerol-3-phosphate 1-O-acyltransferase PlsY [Megasphaera vaginalis (ex Srinivasan et al. 2021)]ERT58170.1 acyl-phosphate glycerol 3-phosphate acyltransferase [Megasphaera vaginalis (ex Srinivasan et al. 2021)]
MMSLLYLLLAYIVGSFPSGLVVGKFFFHTDLREYGSHNIGATNAYRVLGAMPGLAVLILDIAKGVSGVWLGKLAGAAAPEYQIYLMIAGGLIAIIGHSCSLFLQFKGGKGVATGLGVILFLAPVETAIVFLVWCVIVAVTRIVSLGSIVAAALVPVAMYFFDEPLPVTGFGLLAAVLVIVRHKDNIIRLLHGNELKVERVKTK